MGLPKRKPNVFKPAFCLPPKLRSLLDESDPSSATKWDNKASVIQNYNSFGFVSNPNLLGVRARTSHMIQSDDLQVPPPSVPSDEAATDLDYTNCGSDLEEDGQLLLLSLFFFFVFKLFLHNLGKSIDEID